jgi:hypothetical protein
MELLIKMERYIKAKRRPEERERRIFLNRKSGKDF